MSNLSLTLRMVGCLRGVGTAINGCYLGIKVKYFKGKPVYLNDSAFREECSVVAKCIADTKTNFDGCELSLDDLAALCRYEHKYGSPSNAHSVQYDIIEAIERTESDWTLCVKMIFMLMKGNVDDAAVLRGKIKTSRVLGKSKYLFDALFEKEYQVLHTRERKLVELYFGKCLDFDKFYLSDLQQTGQIGALIRANSILSEQVRVLSEQVKLMSNHKSKNNRTMTTGLSKRRKFDDDVDPWY